MAKMEQSVLVLQGGGALGAYQAGAYAQLSQSGYEPAWVAGISIGAINAAIICGNRPEDRTPRLRAFWEVITAGPDAAPWFAGVQSRMIYGEVVAASVMAMGVAGFFRPRTIASFLPFVGPPALSVYDTSPVRKTLGELVDFDYLNDHGPRLSVGAVEIETANFAYFDSLTTTITPDHIMASGALPPGFAPVEIDGRLYWDGGLVSNTPLQFVMDNLGRDPVCIFQVDLFSAAGSVPKNMPEVAQREKDVRYSSRTRLTTDRYRQLHDIRAAVHRLGAKLPKTLQDDPDLAFLRATGPACPITLVELIHRKQSFETQSKDYEFSRLAMEAHWLAGSGDTQRTLAHKRWKARKIGQDGLQVFDLAHADEEVAA